MSPSKQLLGVLAANVCPRRFSVRRRRHSDAGSSRGHSWFTTPRRKDHSLRNVIVLQPFATTRPENGSGSVQPLKTDGGPADTDVTHCIETARTSLRSEAAMRL